MAGQGARGGRRIPPERVQEHIDWLRSFHMDDLSIARELGIKEKSFERRGFGRKPKKEKQDA